MSRFLGVLAATILMATATAASASFHTFQIEEIYSNADGSVQYIVLHESQGLNGENLLGGRALTVTRGAITRQYRFDSSLPGATMLYGQAPTAGSHVLIATSSFAALGLVTPDYIIPDRFLPTDGATLDYAGVDQVSYPALPTDGANAFLRDGRIDANHAVNFVGRSASVTPQPVGIVEYYNAALDHYFISASEPDIDALDSGRITGWTRTGEGFRAFPSQQSGGAGVNPVCRFYIPPEHGNSHFFSASPAECGAIQQKTATDPNYSGYVLESPGVFYVALPEATTGACPAGTVAVSRLWNQRADSNHRYTTSAAVKAQMIAKGYVAEGYGPQATIMCAPM